MGKVKALVPMALFTFLLGCGQAEVSQAEETLPDSAAVGTWASGDEGAMEDALPIADEAIDDTAELSYGEDRHEEAGDGDEPEQE